MKKIMILVSILLMCKVTMATASTLTVGTGTCNSVSGTFPAYRLSDSEQINLIKQSEAMATLEAIKNCSEQGLRADISQLTCRTTNSGVVNNNGQPHNIYAWTVTRNFSSICMVSCY